MESKGCIGIIENALKGPLPGSTFQQRMSPSVRKGEFPGKNHLTQAAAVLILLYYKNGKLHTTLIRRTEYPGAHSGQICFPGGKREKNDQSLAMTALRESGEELGLVIGHINLLGALSPLFIPVSNFEVHPVVGYIAYPPGFTPDPAEVSEVLEIPLEELLKMENSCSETREILEQEVLVPYYLIGGNKIWGATAMILSEFLEIVALC